jgi:hypothetical protein
VIITGERSHSIEMSYPTFEMKLSSFMKILFYRKNNLILKISKISEINGNTQLKTTNAIPNMDLPFQRNKNDFSD